MCSDCSQWIRAVSSRLSANTRRKKLVFVWISSEGRLSRSCVTAPLSCRLNHFLLCHAEAVWAAVGEDFVLTLCSPPRSLVIAALKDAALRHPPPACLLYFLPRQEKHRSCRFPPFIVYLLRSSSLSLCPQQKTRCSPLPPILGRLFSLQQLPLALIIFLGFFLHHKSSLWLFFCVCLSSLLWCFVLCCLSFFSYPSYDKIRIILCIVAFLYRDSPVHAFWLIF